MSSRLLLRRRFAPLFWTQAVGTFNDTLLCIVLLRTAWRSEAYRSWSFGPVPVLLAACFILALLAFSSWGGLLADRLDKQRLVRRLKLLELLVMLLAALALWFESLVLLYMLVLGAALRSALFGPVKYAILPQHVAPTELVNGNAWLMVGMFLALLAATLLGVTTDWLAPPWDKASVSIMLVSVALLGLVVSFGVPAAPPAARTVGPWHPWHSSRESWRQVRRERHLVAGMLGVGAYWYFCIGLLLLLPTWTRSNLESEEIAAGLMLTAFVFGVGAGSLLCAYFSAGRLETGLISLGALVAGAASLFLATLTPGVPDADALSVLLGMPAVWKGMVAVAFAGIGAGLYCVPLYTLLQAVSHDESRGRMLGAANTLNAAAASLAIVYIATVLVGLESGPRPAIAGLGSLAVLVGAGLLLRRPRPVLRLLIFALVHVIYRLRFKGRHNIPVRGPALVVCNHVSFMDALVLGGASPRPLRFLMDQPIYESPWLNWWFRIVGAIPVDSDRRDPGNVRRALSEVSHALRQGEVVMLFPEGRLTPDGEIQRFRRGLDMILARDPVPVVPAGLAGLWGSWTSHRGGRALTKLPRRFRARVALTFGEPLSPREARSAQIEARVHELKAEADAWVSSRGKPPLTSSR